MKMLSRCIVFGVTATLIACGGQQTLPVLATPELPLQTASVDGGDADSYGAWMDHARFGPVSQVSVDGGDVSTYRYALVAGERTDLPLTGSATWLGPMVAMPIAGENKGGSLIGTAALNYDLAAGGLDVAFSGIKIIDRGAAHTTETVMFADLAVDSGGAFNRGPAGARIHGNFFGPGHGESAGIFEHSQMVGAFGAKRQ